MSITKRELISYRAGVIKLQPMGKISDFINKILLEHSYSHSFTSATRAGMNSCHKGYSLSSLKYLLSGALKS